MPELYPYNPTWLSNRPIAHRGLHGPGVPENSLAAFKAAAAAGYAIELDVRLSSDRQLVVIHDATTRRLTRHNLSVADTPAAELGKLQLLGTRERIPLLADVLKTIRGRTPIAIELKHSIKPRIIGPILVGLLANYSGEVAIESFDPRQLMWFRFHARHLPRLQAASSLPDHPPPRWIKLMLAAMPLNVLTRPHALVLDMRDFPNSAATFWEWALHATVVLGVVTNQRQLKRVQQLGYNYLFDRLRPPTKRRP